MKHVVHPYSDTILVGYYKTIFQSDQVLKYNVMKTADLNAVFIRKAKRGPSQD